MCSFTGHAFAPAYCGKSIRKRWSQKCAGFYHQKCGAVFGRAAERDFLRFAGSISNLAGGVYLSVGSAVMSPMIFEKALAMAQNRAIRQGRHIDDHRIVVVDLALADWDWQKDGEPPPDNSAYYLRYLKTFSRMGGHMQYVTADNRDFLLKILQDLAG